MVLTSLSNRDGGEGREEELNKITCICIVCIHCDQISDKKQLKGGRAHFGSQLEGVACHGREGRLAGVR